ncbi:MAG: 3-phosphoshikimate 1-carboxyvinyltransferase [Deltaproteobacteria bacterium]|nr:3-phosphoshikimate 1-carboxyvinyltransferase [Deltaproteobacteria bacterium]
MWTVRPPSKIRGELKPPGDKSISHRAVLLGSVAQGKSTVQGLVFGEDLLSSIHAMEALGVSIETKKGNLIIEGKGWEGLAEPQQVLDAGNSGTTTRLLLGILSGRPFSAVLTGDASLRSRPMRRVVEPLSQMGAHFIGRGEGDRLPLAIQGGSLRGIRFVSPVPSAQLKSALLLAGLQAKGETLVEEETLSRDHTERMLSEMGVSVTREGNRIQVRGGSSLKGTSLKIPADPSSAAFFVVAALLIPGSRIRIKEVCVNPTRTGLLEVLREMGGKIQRINEKTLSGEPVADLIVESSPLKGVSIDPKGIPSMIDEFPILCVAAACAEGMTTLRGASELRYKESDRIRTLAQELHKMGVRVREFEDGLEIQGGIPLKGAHCQSYGDHRVAMAMTIAGLVAKGKTTVHETDCVATSYPDFWQDLQRLVT